ncbi:MAG: alpha/beta hydrolase [Candidatus Thorarchaeota archaeon]
MSDKAQRYLVDTIHAKSLEDNPLNSPLNRDLHIYLPPDYYENEDTKFPVIFYLHGYGGNNKTWTVTSEMSSDKTIDWKGIPQNILDQIDIDKLATFEKIDDLIRNGNIKSFIFVQPDGSLHVPNIFNRKDLRGNITPKGSFYVNSPYSGNYMDYIVNDVIEYIDSNYRTLNKKEHRALMGGSMGGYGTLYIALHHPEKFIAISSLSPGNLRDIEILDHKLRIPLYTQLFGEKLSNQIGEFAWKDIIDTCDLVFSNENRLIPTVKRSQEGEIIDYNKEARNNWRNYNLISVIEKKPDSLKQLNLQLNCEATDEFGLAEEAQLIHNKLTELGINHDYELYSDPKASLTPHMLGIGYHIIPGIEYCLNFI